MSRGYRSPAVFGKAFEIALAFDDPDGFEGNGKGRAVITEASVRNALDIMARDYTRSCSPKVISDSGDGDTADAFIKCAVFGMVMCG